jgi:hypothetical protein
LLLSGGIEKRRLSNIGGLISPLSGLRPPSTIVTTVCATAALSGKFDGHGEP